MANSVQLLRRSFSYEITEEFNTLRTNLLFAGKDVKTIMFTSCTENEGKSTIALNLAYFLTEIGKKVFFIDCDLRKSILKRNFVMPKKWYGLSHFLSGQCRLQDIIYRTNVESLYVTFAGAVPPSSTQLLSNEMCGKFLKSSEEIVDYVIVDTPPLGMVVDAAIIAPFCDGAILVFASGEIKSALSKDVKEKIESTGCPVLGAVLNKVDHVKTGYYYGKKYKNYYQSYAYRHY
jgi:capsular exopolysaccharide synthesis family protein